MSKYTFILRGKLKFAFAALLAIGFLVAHPTFEVSAKTKRAKYGTIKILTTQGGLLLMIDGKSHGETRTEYRAFDLEPGSHNVEIRLPNGQFWKREIEVPAVYVIISPSLTCCGAEMLTGKGQGDFGAGGNGL